MLTGVCRGKGGGHAQGSVPLGSVPAGPLLYLPWRPTAAAGCVSRSCLRGKHGTCTLLMLHPLLPPVHKGCMLASSDVPTQTSTATPCTPEAVSSCSACENQGMPA